MIATLHTTIREIVAEDYRAAAVFHRHAIDYCCNGGRSVEDACRERGLDAGVVMQEVAAACAPGQPEPPPFSSWDASTLIAHIVSTHHSYVRQSLPTLLAHTAKIASVHGERHPELKEVAQLVESLDDEMTSHMFKEERILFPFIVATEEARGRAERPPSAPFGTVANPIEMMEMEHESAGGAMARIRQLTGGYTPPEDACTTWRVCLKELEAFERDLHTHVHLENNILFPKAIELER